MYTYFDQTRKVLCAMQIVEDAVAGNANITPVFPHRTGEKPNTGGVTEPTSPASYKAPARTYSAGTD